MPVDHRFDVIQELDVKQDTFVGFLQQYAPQIVHFSGHGGKSDGIKLTNKQGMSRTVPVDVLRDLFNILKDSVRCVVLNACYTDGQAQAIAEEIDCVVGMTGEVEDAAAIHFAGGFYQALSNGQDVERAVRYGRLAIRGAGLTQEAMPQLLVKSGVNAADITFV